MATNRHKKFISSHIEGLVSLKEKRSPVRFYTPSSRVKMRNVWSVMAR